MKRLKNLLFYAIVVGTALWLQSCGSNDDAPNPELRNVDGVNHLIKATFLRTAIGFEISAMVDQNPQFAGLNTGIFLDVDIYHVTYPTQNYDGTTVTASGLALIPKGSATLPAISYQHGTILQQSEAPSAFDRSTDLVNLLMVLASSGYAVSAPDYIGYGASQNVPHPFEHQATMGSASYDMLLAGSELAELLDRELSGKLFLAGYSQGGYATMALQRHIEEHSDIEVTMGAPAAGAYNKSGTAAALKDQSILLDNPGAWLWNIHVINTTSGVNRPWSEIVSPANAALIQGQENPMLWPTLSELDRDPNTLFTSDFINGLADGTDETMLAAFRANDNHNWNPTYPIRLYYGTDDTSVFPFHAQSAFEAMQNHGANVSLVAFENADHNGAVIPYWRSIIQLFNSLR